MSNRARSALARAVVGAWAVLGACSSARAINWAANSSGNFSDGTKWTGGVAPGTTSDSAAFSVSPSGAYTVTFTDSPNINGTFVTTNNNVTFVTDGTPRTLTAVQLNVNNAGAVLTLGNSAAPLQFNPAQVSVY